MQLLLLEIAKSLTSSIADGSHKFRLFPGALSLFYAVKPPCSPAAMRPLNILR